MKEGPLEFRREKGKGNPPGGEEEGEGKSTGVLLRGTAPNVFWFLKLVPMKFKKYGPIQFLFPSFVSVGLRSKAPKPWPSHCEARIGISNVSWPSPSPEFLWAPGSVRACHGHQHWWQLGSPQSHWIGFSPQQRCVCVLLITYDHIIGSVESQLGDGHVTLGKMPPIEPQFPQL